MRLQSKYQYTTAGLKTKLYDNVIRQKAFEVLVLHLTVDEDKFGNKDYAMTSAGEQTVYIEIPGNDLQAFQGQTDNNDSYNGGVSVYSYLPIKAWTTSDCLLNKDDIILYKILRYPISVEQTAFLQALQVSNIVSKATNTILYNEYTVAPYTFNLAEYPEIKETVEAYQTEEIEF